MEIDLIPCNQRGKLNRTQGGKANNAGITAESTIYCIFKERGYSVSRQVKVGKSIYGSPIKVDLMIHGLPGFDHGLAIESKWQSAGGSVDEKYPYLVQNIRDNCYPCPVIVIVDGGGARVESVEWLKRQVDGKRLLAVFSFAELMKWVIDKGI